MPPDGRYGVLTRTEIKELHLIEVDDPNSVSEQCYAPASYDLRLGDEYYIPNQLDQMRIQHCSEDGILTLPPFSSVLISTYENVHLPDNVVGRFDLRISWALAGLVFQMGTQIEPGYHGKLFGLLHNMTDKPKRVRYCSEDDRLLTAEFHYTQRPADIPPERRKKLVRLVEFLKEDVVSGSIATLASTTAAHSQLVLARLERQQDDLEGLARGLHSATHNKLSLFLLVASILLSIVLPVTITKFTYDKSSMPLSTASQLEFIGRAAADDARRAITDHLLQHPEIMLYERLIKLKDQRAALAGRPDSAAERERLNAEIQKLMDQLLR